MANINKIDPIILLDALVKKCGSARKFAREIAEDPADICRWRGKFKPITPRAVISICRIYKNIEPYMLLPDLFPKDLKFVFKEDDDNDKKNI